MFSISVTLKLCTDGHLAQNFYREVPVFKVVKFSGVLRAPGHLQKHTEELPLHLLHEETYMFKSPTHGNIISTYFQCKIDFEEFVYLYTS